MDGINWKAIAGWGVVVLLAAGIVIGLLSGWGFGGGNRMGPGMMDGWGYSPFGWIGMIFMWLIPVGFLVLVVLGVVWLVRGLTSSGQGRSTDGQQAGAQLTPREILQIRYARGEISREEYHQMLEDIR